MTRPNRLTPSLRLLLASLLALCIAVRLLAPAGFMPSFAGGSLAIVECPEAEGAPAPVAMPDMPGMDMSGMAMPGDGEHDGKSGFHQLCPYAQAASLVGIDPGAAILLLVVLLAALAPTARALPTFRRAARRERPPSHAPPLPA